MLAKTLGFCLFPLLTKTLRFPLFSLFPVCDDQRVGVTLMHSTMLLVTTSFQMLAIATFAIVRLQVLRKIVELLNANWKQLKCSPIELCRSNPVQTKPAIQQSSIFSRENTRIGEINHYRLLATFGTNTWPHAAQMQILEVEIQKLSK